MTNLVENGNGPSGGPSSRGELNRGANLESIRAAALAASRREAPSGEVRMLSRTTVAPSRKMRPAILLWCVLAPTLLLSALNLTGRSPFGTAVGPPSRAEQLEVLRGELLNQVDEIEDHAREHGSLPIVLSDLATPPFGEGWIYDRRGPGSYRLSLSEGSQLIVYDSNQGLFDAAAGNDSEENSK